MTRSLAARLFALAFGLEVAPVFAHGEEVLISIGAQLFVVIGVVYFLFATPQFRRHWMCGLAGCVFGVLSSWWLINDLPYRGHEKLTTSILAGLPILASGLLIIGRSWWLRSRNRTT